MASEVLDNNSLRFKKSDFKDLEVAIVHYWLVTWRGGEKVLESILKLFPKADIYTMFYDERNCGRYLRNHQVYSSWLNLPKIKFQYQKLFPLYPSAIKSLKLRKKYDLIISSESGPAKGIANPNGTPHLCYIHSPMRYCWGFTDLYLEALPHWLRKIAATQFEKLRKWDETTVDSVDDYVANSYNVAGRVNRYYKRNADVCYPPIALDLFEKQLKKSNKEYFLSFGALVPYKNVRLLVERFNQTGEKLVIIGDGSERKSLESMAKGNISFTGTLPYKEVLNYIRRSKALLFPGEEDFGMIPLEVMSQGIPVIALKKGGALETVVENENNPEQSTGIFFDYPEIDSLDQAIQRFKKIEEQFDPYWIREHARKFGEDYFQKNISNHILRTLNRHLD